jgi:hypothetical protein
MNEIAIIVEGLTEKTFVRDILTPHFLSHGVRIWADLAGPTEHSGGVRSWGKVRRRIRHAVSERRGRIVTTMFDFYGMPGSWPGRTEAAQLPADTRGEHVEKAMLDDFRKHAGEDFRPDLFVPYVQVHEFEALLFSDVTKLAEVLAAESQQDHEALVAKFKTMLDQAGQPEAINDGWDTCPSRRIASAAARYTKPTFGPLVAGRIGLEKLRGACPHFAQWVKRLEALGAHGSSS